MPFLHFDEAKAAAENAVRNWLSTRPQITKAMLLGDLFGSFRLVLWSPDIINIQKIDDILKEQCGVWWSGDITHVDHQDEQMRVLYDGTFGEAKTDTIEKRLAILDRHRSRTSWFINEKSPLWETSKTRPPIVVFYSFKGGLGRSTTLASFAIQRARSGERVCILDLDLDSPGIGRVLAADAEGVTARWGVVDFLIEHSVGEAPLSDYYHRCDRVAGAGEIVVFPTGQMNEAYPDKLARVDLEEAPATDVNGLTALLHRVGEELKPDWILIDARTGISESAGRLLSGMAHLHVLLGTTQDQSWLGLSRVLDRLGKDRILAGDPQAEVILIQAMVPPGEAGKIAKEMFASRAEQEFTERYYAEAEASDQDTNALWTTRDLDTLDAPHVAVAVEYDARIASFGDVTEIADILSEGAYVSLADRILGRLAPELDE